MRALPPYERRAVEVDLPVVVAWVAERPELRAEVVLDWLKFLAGTGSMRIVVYVRDAADVRRTEVELAALMRSPERLRVWEWTGVSDERRRVQQTVMRLRNAEGPGIARVTFSVSGGESRLVEVSLDRWDPEYAAELEAIRPGWVQVSREPFDGDWHDSGR
ncbi:hypothetical protein [Kribbella sp. DT2]|uniref:hypothetical protein n=1 Tax=Kribbella sp. DT2 TaxID=3393427 RepID=UPI003CEB3893